VLAVSAYTVQVLENQFVKMLYATSDGSTDPSKATVTIDGINGRITAKEIEIE